MFDKCYHSQAVYVQENVSNIWALYATSEQDLPFLASDEYNDRKRCDK